MGKLKEEKAEATFDEPTSPQAIEFQNKFDKSMVRSGIRLKEVEEADIMLNEKQQSLKKKIFSLAKMEALVHPDPRLAAVYDEMAENGEEKYGYHYNETIMNIIFNDYILNDAKYLEKYKQAVPKKKKRRDKSGINALKKDAEQLEKRRAEYKKDRTPKQPVAEGSVSYGSSGAFESPAGYKDDVYKVCVKNLAQNSVQGSKRDYWQIRTRSYPRKQESHTTHSQESQKLKKNALLKLSMTLGQAKPQ